MSEKEMLKFVSSLVVGGECRTIKKTLSLSDATEGRVARVASKLGCSANATLLHALVLLGLEQFDRKGSK